MTLVQKRLKKAMEICQKIGAQFTPIRQTLLTLIYSQKEPLSAYELLHLLRKTNHKAESMTVYRALTFLQQHHLIHRLASKNVYAACNTPDERHQAHFLLCEQCEEPREVKAVNLQKAAKKLALEFHFIISDKPIEIIGICKNCNKS